MSNYSTITLTVSLDNASLPLSLPLNLPLKNLEAKDIPNEITPSFLESCGFGYDRDTGFWYRHMTWVTILVDAEGLDQTWSLSVISIHAELPNWGYDREIVRKSALPIHLLMLLGACQLVAC